MPSQPADSRFRAGLTRRLQRKTVASGTMTLPAVPGLIDDYVAICDDTFKALGVAFDVGDLANLRAALEGQLSQAYSASPRSEIVITYEIPFGMAAQYNVKAKWSSLEDAYDNWVANRTPPLFGTEPDARVWDLAGAATDPAEFPVLDIGAGTGRNSLALARRGHPVDAVEMTPSFAEIVNAEAEREGLDVRVLQRDVFAGRDDLRRDYQLILLSEVVSDFRTIKQVQDMFALAAYCLAPGGTLVFNAFLARDGYTPDAAARELGEQCYTSIFTRTQLADAASKLQFDLIADDSVHDYEKAHLPAESWPPTSWYETWTSGLDVFDLPREESPIELRWLVYRRVPWSPAPRTGNLSPSSW